MSYPKIVHLPLGDDPPEATLLYGKDVRESLRALPDASVHMVCTSPPYWGLRDYGTGTWEGGDDPSCDHKVRKEVKVASSTLSGGKKNSGHQHEGYHDVCGRCGAKRVDNQIGLEESPEAFVENLVEVFREVARVLRPDGTLWVNLGDSYCSTAPGSFNAPQPKANQKNPGQWSNWRPPTPLGLKPKDLVGIPWRVALALQADGWYLRNDIVWAKGSCLPESVVDRCTRNHEYVFMFAHPDSGGRYFFDQDAVREEHQHGHRAKDTPGTRANQPSSQVNNRRDSSGGVGYHPSGRNRRTVWNINPKPYKGSHFAVWPPDLVDLMVRAGTSEKGVCSACGAPWKRVTERHGGASTKDARMEMVEKNQARGLGTGKAGTATGNNAVQHSTAIEGSRGVRYETVGWEPTCSCDADIVRATVLDPFSGSATTGMVALEHHRDYIGIDLNPDYLDLAVNRVLGEKAPSDEEAIEPGSVLDLFGG